MTNTFLSKKRVTHTFVEVGYDPAFDLHAVHKYFRKFEELTLCLEYFEGDTWWTGQCSITLVKEQDGHETSPGEKRDFASEIGHFLSSVALGLCLVLWLSSHVIKYFILNQVL